MKNFSFSKLDRYSTCPRCFYLRYVAQVPEKITESLALGKAVHAVIEIMSKTRNTSKGYIEIIADAIGAAYDVNAAEEIVKLAYQPVVLNEVQKGGTVEQHFELPITPDVTLQGFIDLWRQEDGRVVLIDWKTNYKSYYPLDTHQLPLYACYLQQLTGLPVTGRLVFLREGKVYEEEISQARIEESLEWARQTSQEIQEKIKALNEVPNDILFPASPSHLCEYCGYAELCLGEIQSSADQPQSYDDAVRLAGEIVRLEAVLKEKKEQLYRYIEGTGIAVPVGNEKEFRLVGEGYFKWTADAVQRAFEYAQSLGLNPFVYLSISATNAQRLGLTPEQIVAFGAEWREKKPVLRLVKKGGNAYEL